MSDSTIAIALATPEHDVTIAQHFYQLWLDNGVSPDLISDDWLSTTVKFIQNARRDLQFQAFLAQNQDQIIGSVSCQLFAGLYPTPFKIEHRHYGYIWNVYVQADYRRQGIATKLTQAAIAHLKSLNCTRAVLNASPSGKSVYEKLGFVPGNEMVLNLVD
ncbi:MAG: GNAT family N-acetyltransferase [Cyanobacteria bacterium J06600_6]